MKQIYFIRHGQSISNKEGKSAGQSYDVSLTEQGQEQAHKTGKYLLSLHKKNEFDIIISSTLKRADETAQIINEYLKLYKKKSKLIMELNQGIKEGTTFKEFLDTTIGQNLKKMKNKDPLDIALNNNELSQKDFEDKYGIYDPKKETFGQIKERVKKFIEYIDNLDAKRIIVVTHGGFMLAFMSFINKSLMRFDQYALDLIPNYLTGVKNCSMSVFEMKNKKIKLIMWGSMWHLNNLYGGNITNNSFYLNKYNKYKIKYLALKRKNKILAKPGEGFN